MSGEIRISVQPKTTYDYLRVLGGTTGRVVCSFLDLREQERVKRVAKRCIPVVEFAQKRQIAQLFPKEYLHLVGGTTDTLQNLPVRVFSHPRAYAPSYPDHFIGWTQTRPNYFVLHVFKREKDRYCSSFTNHLVYHLLPDTQAKPENKENANGSGKPSPATPSNIFIRYWAVDGPDGPCCFRMKPCCCQPNKYVCWMPLFCLPLGLLCHCTSTLPIEEDFPHRGNRNEYIIPMQERVQGGPTLRYHGIPYIPKPPEPTVTKARKVSLAIVVPHNAWY